MADTDALRERRKRNSIDILEDEVPLTKTTTRVPSPSAEKKAKKSLNKLAADDDAAPFSLVDLLRSIVFVLVASCGLSYVITKNSYFWGMKRPNWTHGEVLKGYWVSGFHWFLSCLELQARKLDVGAEKSRGEDQTA